MRALLVIADIGGYTKFMRVHRINLAHAQWIVSQLLEAVIDGAARPLELAKLEGDAAFFWARLTDQQPAVPADFTQRLARIYGAFAERRRQLAVDRLCDCDGCTQVDQLKLKFVAHAGEVAIQKVKSRRELAGVDVIVVHRMLKNSVPIGEYALVTDDLFQLLDAPYQADATKLDEDLEGLGPVRTHYVDIAALASPPSPAPPPSRFRRLWQWLRMTVRSLPYIVTQREPCQLFRNMEDV